MLLGQIQDSGVWIEIIKAAGQFGWAVFLLTFVLMFGIFVTWRWMNRLIDNGDRFAKATEETALAMLNVGHEIKGVVEKTAQHSDMVAARLSQAAERAKVRHDAYMHSDGSLARMAWHTLEGMVEIHKDQPEAVASFRKAQAFCERDFKAP